MTLWSAVPLWIRLGRGVGNLRAGRPFRKGLVADDGGEAFDSLRLLLWTISVLIPTAGVLIVAGGGAFGGAGSLIHW